MSAPVVPVPRHGLPIGALTSQHFANAYLDIADRHLLSHPGVRAHVRYMDDIVWWCDSRATAMATLADFTRFLTLERGLTLKANAHIGNSGAGITYCGFRVRQALVLPSQRKLVRYRQHMGLMEQALAHGAVLDVDLQRASSSAHAALAHCASQRFRINFWKQQASAYDRGAMLYDGIAVPDQPDVRLVRCSL